MGKKVISYETGKKSDLESPLIPPQCCAQDWPAHCHTPPSVCSLTSPRYTGTRCNYYINRTININKMVQVSKLTVKVHLFHTAVTCSPTSPARLTGDMKTSWVSHIHSVRIARQTSNHKTSLNTLRVNVSSSLLLCFSNFQFSWIALLCFINIFELLLIFLLKLSALIHIWSTHQDCGVKWMWKDTLYLQKCKGRIKNI